MNKHLGRMVSIPVAVVLGAVIAPNVAFAKDGVTGISGCYKAYSTDTYKTNVHADLNAVKVHSSGNKITVTINGYGSAHDCGPAGREKLTPQIVMELSIRIEGKRLSCGGTISGGASGGSSGSGTVGGSVSCNGERSESHVTLKHTCKTVQDCRISLANKTFAPASDGRITQIFIENTVSNGAGHGASSSVDLI